MPELPEVEVTKQGVAPYVLGRSLLKINVMQEQLRWIVPSSIFNSVGFKVIDVVRRAKYILLHFELGSIVIHLGMSGVLRLANKDYVLKKHDHVVLTFSEDKLLVYNDPRRFGCVLWIDKNELATHKLFSNLAPEPLSTDFHADYLFSKLKHRNKTIKSCLMDQTIVVGVGNIYANEVLFEALIHPERPGKLVSHADCINLVVIIKKVLQESIKAGGTTLKDFFKTDGKPGYFSNKLKIYGRREDGCVNCEAEIIEKQLAGRATYFCGQCQLS